MEDIKNMVKDVTLGKVAVQNNFVCTLYLIPQEAVIPWCFNYFCAQKKRASQFILEK